jgi:D-aspartate ligase
VSSDDAPWSRRPIRPNARIPECVLSVHKPRTLATPDYDAFPSASSPNAFCKTFSPRARQMKIDGSLRAAIILGGDQNALSVTRNLSEAGIPVYLLNRRDIPARYSRRGRWIAVQGGSDTPQDWRRYLLGGSSDHLAGAVLLACSDDAIELVVDNWQALSAKFRLEECPPQVRRGLLDKLSTYESAREAKIPVPRFWCVRSRFDLATVAQRCCFPVILKPRLSHHSTKIGRKYARADNKSALATEYTRLARLGVPVVMMEFIPGSDDNSHSYYTYMDETGMPLVNFTKSLLRRYPVNQGIATYHTTEWNPEVAELGIRFFRHVGLRGLGHVEFKRDVRDGQFKIIEANARFTGAHALIAASGIDLALLTYNRLIGRSQNPPKTYRTGMVMWHPLEDLQAFLELRKQHEITWSGWIHDISRTNKLPYFDWRDPGPSIASVAGKSSRFLGYLLANIGNRTAMTEASGAGVDVDNL